MKFIGIIPARLNSKRLSRKPLIEINGKTIIQRTYEQTIQSKLLDDVFVATDSQEIYDHISIFGKVIMTDKLHKSGSERCFQALKIINQKNTYSENDVLINIQGDEPVINPKQIDSLCNMFINNKNINIGTQGKKILDINQFVDSNTVKVVFNKNNRALYFSRLPIPHQKNNIYFDAYKHIGLYGFKIKIINELFNLKDSNLENLEKLEQLKWLEWGFDVFVDITNYDSISIDTKEDLEVIKKFFS